MSENSQKINISVIIPTYQRPEQLLVTLKKITMCVPQPDEIIVHIDGKDSITQKTIENSNYEFEQVKFIQSFTQLGFGGGRNVGIFQANNSLIASFDDDSYPLDIDYFDKLKILFDKFPEAAVITARVTHISEEVAPEEKTVAWVADFVGCGCAYRKDAFQEAGGYAPLPIAYGMEEADLSLRLHHKGWRILQSSWLRVLHDTTFEHRKQSYITPAYIANQALLTYLRYPLLLWWLGFIQCIKRITWIILYERTLSGIMESLLRIPQLIWKYRQYRGIVSFQSLMFYLKLRRNITLIDLKL